MDEEIFINKQTEFCIVVPRAYRRIGSNRLDKVTKAHISLVRNFSKGGNTCIPRNLRLIRGPIGRRQGLGVFGKVCERSLEALREFYLCGGGRWSVKCCAE